MWEIEHYDSDTDKKIINDKKDNVEWDTMSNVDGGNEKIIETVELFPSKWNKDCSMALQMDIDIDDCGGNEVNKSS